MLLAIASGVQKKTTRGQGLTEYLILLCLVSVAAIAVVSVVGQNLRARYASVSAALRGDSDVNKEMEEATEDSYELRGFEDFLEGAKKPQSRRGR